MFLTAVGGRFSCRQREREFAEATTKAGDAAADAADSLCAKLENAALTTEILGSIAQASVFRPSEKPGAVDELPHLGFAKCWDMGQSNLERVRKSAPDRQRQVGL